MRKYIFVFAFLVGLPVLLFSQPSKNRVYHPFTGTAVLTLEGGATYGFTDYKDFSLDYLGKTSLEYYLPLYAKSAFGMRISGAGGYIKGKDANRTPAEIKTDLTSVGASVVYLLSVKEVFFPYFSGGVSYLWFNPKGEKGNHLPNNLAGVYKKDDFVYSGELGFRFLMTENLTFNIASSANILKTDYLDDVTSGTSNDLFFAVTAGLSFSFFGDADSDGDGVVDSKDMCPETPSKLKVDIFGCPVDSDKDGVADYLDKCTDTPDGVKVDNKGCPLDADNDGVADYLDICPNTPKSVQVDEFGCPLDSDNDGIANYMDKCPGTLIGVQVDQDGCPNDTDNDGVADYLDKCSNTAKGVQVDEDGCQIIKKEVVKEVPVIKEVVLSAGTSFAVGKSSLLPGSFSELESLVKIMKSEPGSRWLIEGHTDNTGSYNNNKNLSLNRANSVLDFFISKGINAARFTVRGMGSDYPIADNTTPDGRGRNRRVTILRVN